MANSKAAAKSNVRMFMIPRDGHEAACSLNER
jgi:hypothetical protein